MEVMIKRVKEETFLGSPIGEFFFFFFSSFLAFSDLFKNGWAPKPWICSTIFRALLRELEMHFFFFFRFFAHVF